MTNKTKYHVKKHFCRCYLQCFSSSKVLKCHIKNVLVINHTKLVLLSGKDQYIDFQNNACSKRSCCLQLWIQINMC